MTDPRPKADFQFVNATMTNPRGTDNHETRVLIRKQAMKQTSSVRRRQGRHGKHNLCQYPIFHQDSLDPSRPPISSSKVLDDGLDLNAYADEEILQDKEKDVRSRNTLRMKGHIPQLGNGQLVSKLKFPSSLSPQGFEAVVALYGFNVIDLSTLVSLQIGRCAAQALSADPSQFPNLLRCKQWSYMTYVPSRYGSSACLDDAVECIAARVRQILSPNEGKLGSKVIPLYLKALKSLQKSLDNLVQCFEPEVLCAIEILGLYELLNPYSTEAWIRHAAGATRLIQFRGSDNYKTDFEKALLIAHAGPIMTETMFNNETCFLEEDRWQAVFRSLVLEDSVLTERSEMSISILTMKARVPGIYRDATLVICNDNVPDELEVKKIALSTRVLLQDLTFWLCKHRDILLIPHDTSTSASGYQKRSEIMSTYLSCSMVTTRLLASMFIGERASMEKEAQRLACQTLELERVTKLGCPQGTLLLAQAVAVAHSIQRTAEEWKINEPIEAGGAYNANLVIERWKYEHWCEMVGRKVV